MESSSEAPLGTVLTLTFQSSNDSTQLCVWHVKSATLGGAAVILLRLV